MYICMLTVMNVCTDMHLCMHACMYLYKRTFTIHTQSTPKKNYVQHVVKKLRFFVCVCVCVCVHALSLVRAREPAARILQ